jgi:hypothetical protein
MEWSNSGEFLAIAGSRPVEVMNENGIRFKEYVNHLQIYSPAGVRILDIVVPYALVSCSSQLELITFQNE